MAVPTKNTKPGPNYKPSANKKFSDFKTRFVLYKELNPAYLGQILGILPGRLPEGPLYIYRTF